MVNSYKRRKDNNTVIEFVVDGGDVGKECQKCICRFKRGDTIYYYVANEIWNGNFCEKCYLDIEFIDLIR